MGELVLEENKQKIPNWMFYGFVAIVIGFFAVFIVPAFYQKMQAMSLFNYKTEIIKQYLEENETVYTDVHIESVPKDFALTIRGTAATQQAIEALEKQIMVIFETSVIPEGIVLDIKEEQFDITPEKNI